MTKVEYFGKYENTKVLKKTFNDFLLSYVWFPKNTTEKKMLRKMIFLYLVVLGKIVKKINCN